MDLKLDKIYPEHFEALNKADLLEGFEALTLGARVAEMEERFAKLRRGDIDELTMRNEPWRFGYDWPTGE